MARPSRIPPPEDVPHLTKALKRSKQATDAIQEAAEDLAVVHTVLDSQVPKETLHPDVGQAIEQTDQLKDKLRSAEEKLKSVNEALEQQVASSAS
jgi:chromosome segregation ATPase